MSAQRYRFTFTDPTTVPEAEATLVLALFAVEAIHGEAQARLDAAHFFDLTSGVCIVDASTEVGRCLTKLFVGLLTREFGRDGFRVEHLHGEPAAPSTGGTNR